MRYVVNRKYTKFEEILSNSFLCFTLSLFRISFCAKTSDNEFCSYKCDIQDRAMKAKPSTQPRDNPQVLAWRHETESVLRMNFVLTNVDSKKRVFEMIVNHKYVLTLQEMPYVTE